MKKLFFALLTTSMSIITSIQANKLQESVQQLYDKTIQSHQPILAEQLALIKKTTPHAGFLGLYSYLDEEQELLRKSPETKEFLRNFYIYEPQAMGIEFCHQCLKKNENPTSQDLQTCFEKWQESSYRRSSFKIAKANEKNFGFDHRELRNALHQGNHIFEKRIRKIIKEHSQEQK